jgi:NAD binding domain of 6-phosphogluconate dehydrogenase
MPSVAVRICIRDEHTGRERSEGWERAEDLPALLGLGQPRAGRRPQTHTRTDVQRKLSGLCRIRRKRLRGQGFVDLLDFRFIRCEYVLERRRLKLLNNLNATLRLAIVRISNGNMYPEPLSTIAFVGLGAMGFGMASHLVKKGHPVIGFDVHEPTRARFREAGGEISHSPQQAARRANVFICMVTNSKQVDSVLFDPEDGAAEGT